LSSPEYCCQDLYEILGLQVPRSVEMDLWNRTGGTYDGFTLWLINIAMERSTIFRFGKPLFLWAIYPMAMLVITRGFTSI